MVVEKVAMEDDFGWFSRLRWVVMVVVVEDGVNAAAV